MSFEIVSVNTRADLKRFIKYPFKLYQNDPNWVPPLIRDEMDVLSETKNPGIENCEVKLWLAMDGNKVVGRIAGIIESGESKKERLARFGWIDFEENPEISRALLEKVEVWAKEHSLSGLHGPLGFTDMDFEGMLIEGFEYPATIATIYNYPYYPEYMEKHGYKKSVDWVEGMGTVPGEPSKKLLRTAQLVESRFGLRSLELKSRKQAAQRGKEMFDVLNKSYANLYGFHPLTDKQIDYYIKQYLGFVIPDMMSMVVNQQNELVAFAVTMPSLTEAFQKANGKLFPFGFIHILRGLKTADSADLYLVGVLPEYQKLGATAIIFRDIILAFNRHGIKTAKTNQVLEENQHLLTQFNDYQENGEIYKRRRCYIKRF